MADFGQTAAAQAPGRSQSARQQERRARILTAAYDLLAAHGYDAVSMRLIAKSAHVSERTLFNIYATKDALIATSARERTEQIIDQAWQDAADHGVGFFLSLCRTLSTRTLEQPAVARALAPVLVQHADLVRLDEVYRRYVGRSLDTLVKQGVLEGEQVDVLTGLFSIRMVGAVTLWAGHAIADQDLEIHMRLAVCQILLPHARGELLEWSGAEARRCVGRLAGSPTP